MRLNPTIMRRIPSPLKRNAQPGGLHQSGHHTLTLIFLRRYRSFYHEIHKSLNHGSDIFPRQSAKSVGNNTLVKKAIRSKSCGGIPWLLRTPNLGKPQISNLTATI